MQSKRILSIILAMIFVASCFVGCSSKKSDATSGDTVTQIVTNESGEVVTNARGEVVTEVINTAQTTQPSSVTTTAKGQTTTSKNNAGKSTTKAGSKNGKTTTKKGQTTTKAAPKPVTIQLVNSADAKCSSSKVSIAKSDYRGEIYIEKPGDYVIRGSGQEWHGQIFVKLKNTQKADIRFENVSITSTTNNIIQIIDTSISTNRSFIEAEADIANVTADNAIQEVASNDKAPNVSLSFPTGTASMFKTRGSIYTGVIYNESKLTIKGNGSVAIVAENNPNNCICSTKSVTIKNAGVTLTTEGYNIDNNLGKKTGSGKGIFSYSKVTVESGTLNILSNGDGIRCDRFYGKAGTVNINSATCDGIDADDSIIISSGKYSSKAKKYSYKVRRVNNTEDNIAGGKVRAGKGDCFKINGGTVTGEGKKITSLLSRYQSDKSGSKQASVTCKAVKESRGNEEQAALESKVPVQFNVNGLSSAMSSQPCIKYLYSSSKVVKGKKYKINSRDCKWTFSGSAGVAEYVSSTTK